MYEYSFLSNIIWFLYLLNIKKAVHFYIFELPYGYTSLEIYYYWKPGEF